MVGSKFTIFKMPQVLGPFYLGDRLRIIRAERKRNSEINAFQRLIMLHSKYERRKTQKNQTKK